MNSINEAIKIPKPAEIATLKTNAGKIIGNINTFHNDYVSVQVKSCDAAEAASTFYEPGVVAAIKSSKDGLITEATTFKGVADQVVATFELLDTMSSQGATALAEA